jgi:hypothetical protein
MNRRQALTSILMAAAGSSLLQPKRVFAQDASSAAGPVGIIYLHPAKGADTNTGTKVSPLRTLAAAAKRVSESSGSDAATVILSEGVYAVGETAVFKVNVIRDTGSRSLRWVGGTANQAGVR